MATGALCARKITERVTAVLLVSPTAMAHQTVHRSASVRAATVKAAGSGILGDDCSKRRISVRCPLK
ncbi:MAG: hypothetical protein WBV37_16115 [Nocardioidaceae bacterium]